MSTGTARRHRRALWATVGLGVVLAASLSSCGGSSSGGKSNVGATTTPSATDTSTGRAVSTALDPCQLVTAAEASALAGTTFGAGAEEPNGSGKRCVYGAQTQNVFTVEVVQAQDAATAGAAWTSAQTEAHSAVAQAVPQGVRLSLVTSDNAGVGDKSSTVFGSTSLMGHSFGFSGIYVLKGPTFFAFQDLVLSAAPPSVARMTTQANTTLGRVS